ncbi:PIF1-like helicase-domain-containing protein [Thelephora terrestris]|uniref:ATP-dependent DNA helicase n=1 Tax=Thelephora terrestris TaxID=56493 RepID=A0A9P6L3W7_9AGAM|nr:PIF1-like helicase-domain-containing protein [Thelephora terrestris]
MSLGSKDDVSDAAKKKLQDFWRNIRYLIIDEYSMLSKSFLAALSRNISIGMEGSQGFRQATSFGGLNVILCGDLHQFPPVACGKRESLYYPVSTDDKLTSQVGRKIYEEFSTVIILKEQMRVTDHIWRDFLNHLRYGMVERRHLTMLRTLLLKSRTQGPSNTPPSSDPPLTLIQAVDFSTHPWADASLITPRHAVRIRWNQAAAQKQCSDATTRLFVCPSLDTIKGSSLTLEERYALANLPKKSRRRDKGLPEFIHLAIGMKVMVTNNLQTDLDVTNGARGIIADIILNPDEPPLDEGSVTTLKHLPECILVKLSRTRAAALPGLDEGIIPIQRVSTKTQIRVRGKSRTVTRTHVVVDIASPPTSGLSLFNLYVALSRSSGRDTIRLLRDFDDSTFLQGHVPELLEEDERLGGLDVMTREWWAKMAG